MSKNDRNHPPTLERRAPGVGQQLRDIARQWGETATRASDDFQKNLEDIETGFEETRDKIVSKTKKYARSTNGYVTENPWLAVGISTGIGFLLGMIIGKRRSS